MLYFFIEKSSRKCYKFDRLDEFVDYAEAVADCKLHTENWCFQALNKLGYCAKGRSGLETVIKHHITEPDLQLAALKTLVFER